MFYSIEILRKRKSHKGRLPFCWIASMNSSESNSQSSKKKSQAANFVGTGYLKISKKDVEQVDVVATCDEILEGLVGADNKRFSLYLSSHLTSGLLRIYKEQVRSLEEETEKLFADVMGGGAGRVSGGVSGKKKRKQNNQIDQDPVDALLISEDNNVTNDFDANVLFPQNRLDDHQIIEVEPIPSHNKILSFGDELLPLDLEAFANIDDIREGPNPNFEDDFIRNPENQEQVAYENVMQGEALHQDSIHEERINPSRPVIDDQNANFASSSKMAVADDRIDHNSRLALVDDMMDIDPPLNDDALCILLNQNEGIQSPAKSTAPPENFITPKRKSRHPHDETPTKRTRIVTDDGAPDMDNHRRFSALSESSPVPRRSLFPPVGEQASNLMILQNSIEPHEAPEQPLIDLQAADETIEPEGAYYVPQNNSVRLQSLSSTNDQNTNSSDAFSLAPLEVLEKPKRRKRAKKAQSNVIDEERQLNRLNDDPYIETRPRGSIRPKVSQKVPANNLLAIPATAIKITPMPRLATRIWAAPLIRLFNDHIKDICDFPLDISKHGTPRDIPARKLPHVSSNSSKCRRKSKSVPDSNPTTPARRTEQLSPRPDFQEDQPQSVQNLNDDEGVFQNDEVLIPPINECPPQSHLAVTPTNVRSPATVRPENLMPSPSQGMQVPDPVPETDNTFLPRRHTESMERQSAESSNSDSQSPKRVDSILTQVEFYEVLVRMWSICAQSERGDKALTYLEFDDILPPQESSIQELIIYFMYCCELEKQSKLLLRQNVPYKGVSIIELEEEREKESETPIDSEDSFDKSSS
ncbi:hypothetical protein QAD02_023368 [Eretmocerus hayati]|uniref:Uncharacterized protein n=1 Tax=Eretmocerus hayati TaxID=131215 RepID=A0ACC2PY41_9HYME|nr:hypothetical protein QAD02_023368 [Eretmocerus hayati]